jgi:hypothetical protein
MNAWPWLFLNDRTARKVARLTACAGLGALGAACVGDPVGRAHLAPSSPVAADAARLVRANHKFPTFAQIPAAPKDVRAPAAFRSAVTDAETARDQLLAETAPNTWTLSATEHFAAGANAHASDDDDVTSRDTEGFARTARERATPPPPPR